jgi:hypothetical protein
MIIFFGKEIRYATAKRHVVKKGEDKSYDRMDKF